MLEDWFVLMELVVQLEKCMYIYALFPISINDLSFAGVVKVQGKVKSTQIVL